MKQFQAFMVSAPTLFMLVMDTDEGRLRYMSATAWHRSIGGKRGHREVVSGNRLHHVHHVRYERQRRKPVQGVDELRRRVMWLDCGDLHRLAGDPLDERDVRSMFLHREDVDAALDDLGIMATLERMVQEHGPVRAVAMIEQRKAEMAAH